MTVEINHGNPWYLSPDIWVVPGDDPDGTPGIPAAGEGSYVWARVHNTGTVEVENVEVDFYWGNPATTLTPGSCTLIGSSFVSPPPGDAEVLCVSQWVPSWVNNGHECLIVQLIEPGSTPPSPAVPFNPQSDPQCAQHNLSLLASTGTMMNLRFGAGGFRYEGADRGVLRVRRAPLSVIEKLNLGIAIGAELDEVTFGLSHLGTGCEDSVGTHQLTHTTAGEAHGFVLAIQAGAGDGAALLLVEEHVGDRVVGGLGALVLGPEHPASQAHHTRASA